VQLARTLAGLRRADERRPAQTQAVQQAQQARAAERAARYEHILELQKHEMKSGEIARTLGMSQRTIQRWIATGTIPYARRKRPRASLIDPYKSYLWKRWQQGCHAGAQLARELRAKGYKGSPHGVYRYLETLKAATLAPSTHKLAAKLASSIQPSALLTLSASQATWLQKVEASHLQALQTFVTGVHKDQEAVLAGLTLPWSTGPVEGQVNRGIRSLNAACMVAPTLTCCACVSSYLLTRITKLKRRR
jgi:transposase